MPLQFVQQNVEGDIWKIDQTGGTLAVQVYPLVAVPLVWNGTTNETIPALTRCTLNPGGTQTVDMRVMDYLVIVVKGGAATPWLVPYSQLTTLETLFAGGIYQILRAVGLGGSFDWQQ